MVPANCRAERNRNRPPDGEDCRRRDPAARRLADLSRSRTPRQIAGRLVLEASDPSVGTVSYSPAACGATARHEAIYRFIYVPAQG